MNLRLSCNCYCTKLTTRQLRTHSDSHRVWGTNQQTDSTRYCKLVEGWCFNCSDLSKATACVSQVPRQHVAWRQVCLVTLSLARRKQLDTCTLRETVCHEACGRRSSFKLTLSESNKTGCTSCGRPSVEATSKTHFRVSRFPVRRFANVRVFRRLPVFHVPVRRCLRILEHSTVGPSCVDC